MNPLSYEADFTYRFAWYSPSGISRGACPDVAWSEHLGKIGAYLMFNIPDADITYEYIWHLLGDRATLPHEEWDGTRLEGVTVIRTRSPLVSVSVVYALGGVGGSIDVEYIVPFEVVDSKVPWGSSSTGSRFTTRVTRQNITFTRSDPNYPGENVIVIGKAGAVDPGSWVRVDVPIFPNSFREFRVHADALGRFVVTTNTGGSFAYWVWVGGENAAGDFTPRYKISPTP